MDQLSQMFRNHVFVFLNNMYFAFVSYRNKHFFLKSSKHCPYPNNIMFPLVALLMNLLKAKKWFASLDSSACFCKRNYKREQV